MAQTATATPIRLSHQGRLLAASGAPVEGDHALEVQLLTDGGEVLWTDTFSTTAFRAGYFHVVLGSQRPLDGELFQGPPPSVALRLNDGPAIIAAEPIAHVPYAAVADHANTAGHATSANTATTAETADRATAADTADRATAADTATHAETAGTASRATTADHATTAGRADEADRAILADEATTAGRAAVAEALEADELELVRLTSAQIDGGAATLDTLNAGRVDADVLAGEHLQSTTALIGTVQAGRVNAVVALGAGSGLVCDPGNRGVLRYPPGGPLQICQTSGWAEVGAAEGAGTCSIVGECPDGGEPSRVWFGDLSLSSASAIEHFCTRYDSAIGTIQIGLGSGPFFNEPSSLSFDCLTGTSTSFRAGPFPSATRLLLPTFEGVQGGADVHAALEAESLAFVGGNTALNVQDAQSTLPSLTTVGGDLTWTWASGTSASQPLPDFLPAIETVGGKLVAPATGPLVPLPNLTFVGGAYDAPTVSAPALREIAGNAKFVGPHAPFPNLETVGSLTIGLPNASSRSSLTQPPFAPDGLPSLGRIEGNLSIRCVIGWEQPQIDAFIDAVGRSNIGGTITTRTSTECFNAG